MAMGHRPWAEKLSSSPTSVLVTSLVTAFLSIAVYFYRELSRTFTKRPSHFVARSWLDSWSQPKVNAPLVDVKDNNYRDALARGSAMYPDRAYRVRHFPGEIVIIPHRCIDEIKNSTDAKLSFQQGSYDFFLGDHTGITGHEKATASLLRGHLGRLLDRVYSVVEDEAVKSMKSEIGQCDTWTELTLFPVVVKMIIMISQRVFVGEPLCHDEEWYCALTLWGFKIKAITIMTQGAFESVPDLWPAHPIYRPFIAWKHPRLNAVRKARIDAKRIIKPVIQQRLEDSKKPGFEPPSDLIQLVMDTVKGGRGKDVDFQITAQVGTSRAALFTTASTVTHLMYDLASRPEYIEPLREEVLALGDVPMNRLNVLKLRKMDSFIRECQRFALFMLVGTIRKVTTAFTMADGTHLPVGALVGVDTHHNVFNHSTLENPEVFDGFRFERLRSAGAGSDSKFQAVSTGEDHLVFGLGTQACPGRFFAIHEAKVLMARFLKLYEFKLSSDAPGHPMRNAAGVLTVVDPTAKFWLKRRQS
ncbi:cytochrome P450 [Xylariaceae sp. AK1471]|nr:cytochrome P450 [Xylariaceae sp. AK1471]